MGRAPFTLRRGREELGNDGPESAGAVAEDPFDVGAEIAEGAVIFGQLKQRVVAKAVVARGREADAAVTNIVTFGADGASGISDRDVAHVVGRAFFQRQ